MGWYIVHEWAKFTPWRETIRRPSCLTGRGERTLSPSGKLFDGFRLRNMFQTGYILSRRADLVWFLGLPFAAIFMALGAQRWLPFVAVASINLWITVPHHYATWVRTYGMPEDWQRFKP